MLSECSEDNGIKHKEIVRPDFSWYQKDWFTEDPATNLEKDQPGMERIYWRRL